jgi:hypothetical protein
MYNKHSSSIEMNNGLPGHIYRIDNIFGDYWITFWSPVTGICLYRASLHHVPTEEQMNEMTSQPYSPSILLEDGPSPHFALYNQ